MPENKENRKRYNSQRSTAFVAVLHIPYNRSFLDLDFNKLNSCFVNFAYILHDNDVVSNLDFNIDSTFNLPVPLKPVHFHLVLITKDRTYPSSINKILQNLFDLPDCCVSVEKCLSLNLSLRYLIHADDHEKYQYHFDRIFTNNYVWLLSNFNQSETAIQQFVYNALVSCNGDYDSLLLTIGFGLAKKYYQIINQYFRVYYHH